MSRIDRLPVSGSLSQTTRRIVTLRGTVKFMPRSWHSGTSYLNFKATGSPQWSQISTVLRDAVPHSGQAIEIALEFAAMVRLPHEPHVILRRSIPSRLPHLHSQFPMEYSTNSSELVYRKSWMGNSDLKTACSPT